MSEFRSWYVLEIHGKRVLSYLTSRQVADLQVRGLSPEPSPPPPDLAERIGALLAGLVQLSS